MSDNPSVSREFRFKPFWHEVFGKWLLLVKEYEDPKATNIDLAYWHGERALIIYPHEVGNDSSHSDW